MKDEKIRRMKKIKRSKDEIGKRLGMKRGLGYVL